MGEDTGSNLILTGNAAMAVVDPPIDNLVARASFC